MTTIDLQWSAQAAQLHAPGQSRVETVLGSVIDNLLPSVQDVASATYNFGGSGLTANLGNGAVLAVDGVGLGQSVITADSLRLFRSGTGSIELPGDYAIRYALVGGSPQVLGVSGHVASVAVSSQWLPGSANLDAALGNVTVRATGALTVDDNLSVHGRLDNVEFSTSSGAVHGSVQGEFNVNGQGGIASATLAAAHFDYADGSFLRVEGAHIDAADLTLSGAAAVLGNAANFAGDDVFRLDVATPGILPMIDSGAGNDRITLSGAHYDVAMGDGDDTITILEGKASIQGGAGFDTAIIAGKQADYVASHSGTWHVFVHPDGTSSIALQAVERIQFDDGFVAFDIDGHAGQAYRLYTAALGRAPDAAGLGYWIGVLDGGAGLHAVASEFVSSAEFAKLVGADADNATFLTKLYNNILHRAPDTAGLQYWQGVLDGGAGRAGVVVEFSEGGENQAQVIGAIQDGIDFVPYR